MSEFLTRKGAAQHLTDRGLPVSPNTLQKWATTGGGPRYRRFGNRAVYTTEDLDSWVEEKLSPPRSSSTAA